MSELETFVLDYLEQVGSIVEPAVYDIHEVLLPETVAERWQTAAYQQIAFADVAEEETTRLGYNHPLVEQMVTEARSQVASTCTFINGLRLHKDGLEELAAKEWVVLNGRVMPQRRATVARMRCTYIHFNFKAALLSDEKQERLVSVLMDAHTGYRVAAAAEIEQRATAATPDGSLQSLPDAPIYWQLAAGQPLKDPLERHTLDGLLARAKTAVLQEYATYFDTLQKRVNRFRQLDEARLTEYYDEMERDLQHRLSRAAVERRASLADKLAAVKGERAQKLADIAERYQMRLNLTLLNLMVIQQPKLVLPVTIENRTAKVSVHAVWDPLQHHLEPLACQVCGRPSRRTYLCHNGHLAHEDCLAPACIDCKRIFCRHCNDELGTCDVCQKPLCRHSRIICDECGRSTCQAHIELCHANKGEPVDLKAKAPTSPAAEPATTPPAPKPEAKKPQRSKPARPPSAAKVRQSPLRAGWPKGVPKPQQIEIVVHHDAVAAYLLASRERQIAARVWELVPSEGGIVRTCECEKGAACRANNMIMRPSGRQSIASQIMQEIHNFREEYGLPFKKLKFNRVASLEGQFIPMPHFKLFGLWQDEEALTMAQANFERIYWK